MNYNLSIKVKDEVIRHYNYVPESSMKRKKRIKKNLKYYLEETFGCYAFYTNTIIVNLKVIKKWFPSIDAFTRKIVRNINHEFMHKLIYDEFNRDISYQFNRIAHTLEKEGYLGD